MLSPRCQIGQSPSSGGAGLVDGDYGDVTVSGVGTVMTIDAGAVTYAKMQDVSATDKMLGRSTAGAGDVEEIPCTAFGRSLIDDAAASNARTTLGLGTVATLASDTDGTLAANSDVTVATQKATKTYADTKQAGDATLTALAAYNTNGVLTQTAADTFVGRTLTGTANQITVSNGDGVAGAPIFSIPSDAALPGSPTTTTATVGDNTTKIATTAFVRTAVLSVPGKEACKYASIAALPAIVYANGSSGVGATLTGVALGAISLDSNSPAVADRILIKDQVATEQNGIYTVTATGSGIAVFVITRAVDFDQATDIETGAMTYITAGATLAGTTWDVNSANSPVMGTDPITFIQTTGPGSFVGGNGITITGNSIAINTAVTVDLNTAQTLTNKTLTSPKINENVAVTATATELNYTDGVTSAIQTQLDSKIAASLYDANTVLAATADNTPVALTVGEQTLVGRVSGGNIAAIAIDSDLTAVSAAHDTVPSAKATSVAISLKANDADVVHDTGDETVAGVKTFSSDPLIPDEAYGVGWNGSLEPPTKNAVYDKIETLGGSGHTITEEGGAGLTARATLNFIGAAVTAADDAGNTRTNVTVASANTTTEGTAEAAIASEINTGTDAARYVSPDALAGSNFGIRIFTIQVYPYNGTAVIGDSQAIFRVPIECNGMNLVSVGAQVYTAGTTNTLDIQVRNKTDTADMLSTKLTIDSTEVDSSTATAAVINGATDDVVTGDLIAIDIDAVHTTPSLGLTINLGFQLP